MKRVDTHAHIFSAKAAAVKGARYQPEQDAPVTSYVAHLDTHGLEYGVLIQPSFLGFDNSQMLAAIAQYPERLKGVAVVPHDVTAATLHDLGRQGVVGARLNLFGKECPDLGRPEWQQFLARLDEAGWQLELHCPPAYLRVLLAQLHSFRSPVVLDHFGRVDPDKGVADPDYQAVLQLLKPGRHWVKVSGFYRLSADDGQAMQHAEQALKSLVERDMSQHLVWGSDWPHTQNEGRIDYDGSVQALHQLVCNERLRIEILSDNALSLFGFSGS